MPDFKDWFNNAVGDERFHSLDPLRQQQVIWGLMDKDQNLAGLNDDERFKFLEGFATPPETPGLGDKIAEIPYIGKQLLPDPLIEGQGQTARDTFNKLGETRVVRQGSNLLRTLTERGIPATIEGLNPAIEVGGQGIEDLLNHVMGQFAGDQAPQADLGVEIETAQDMVNRSLMPIAEGMREAGKYFPDIDRTTWKKVKESEGAIDTVLNFSDWVAGGAADTVGIMAPAAAVAIVTGAPLWATMTPTMTGLQAEEFREEGVDATNLELVLSGLTQAVLGSKFGVESLIGAAPNSFVKNIFSKGFQRGLWRTAGGIGGEVSTEFVQEYINQQLPKWEKGDQFFWSNLDPSERNEIVEGAMLAGVLQIPASVIGSAESGWIESAMEQAKKRQKVISRLRGMTPEERGAEGHIVLPKPVRGKLTQDEENQVRTNYAPEFLTDPQKTEFVLGTLDPRRFSPEQIAELEAAEEKIAAELEPQVDVNVEPVEQGAETRVEQAGLDEVKALAMVRAARLDAEGDTEGAAQVREAIDSLEIVSARSKELATIQGFAAKFGAKINFFRAKNGTAIGSNGVSVGTNGDIFVRWDATTPQAVAAVALHEVVHVIGRRNFDALQAMHEALTLFRPERMQELESWVREQYAQHGITISEEDLMQETVAYMAQDDAASIFGALQMAAQNYDFDEKPGPIKKVLDGFRDIVRRAIRVVPAAEGILGPRIGAEFDNKNRRETTQMLGQFVRYLRIGEARTPLNIQPDNFGRRGRKTIETEAVPAKAVPPRRPGILEDVAPPRPLTIVEDTGKRAGKRKVVDIREVAPPEARTPRILLDEPRILLDEEAPEGRGEPRPGVVTSDRFKQTIFLDEKLPKAELARIKASDRYKEIKKNADEGNWETVSAEAFHKALNENPSANTLTPYTVENLKGKEFKLFKLKDADIWFAMKGTDIVGLINNEPFSLPGVATDGAIIFAVEQGAETLDAFDVKSEKAEIGFLPERYARFGFRLMTTEEMPQWAQEAGGKDGRLPFSEEAYLEEHSEEDLRKARDLWEIYGDQVGKPPVVFMTWDPPAGITRENIREKAANKEIGTKEAANKQLELALRMPSKPSEVKLGPRPVEAVRTPRTPRILLDEPVLRTTAARLEVGDQLEVDESLVSVTKSEPKGNKRILHYVDQEGNVSRVTVSANKRYMKFENPQEVTQPDLFEAGTKVTPEQQALNFAEMETEEEAVAKVADGTKFSLVIRGYELGNELSSGMEGDAFTRLMEIDRNITHWMRHQAPGTVSYILEDETGLRGFVILRERYQNTDDREAHVEFIAALYDKDGNEVKGDDRYTALGIRNVMALGPEIARFYPEAIWVGGDRIGGIRAEWATDETKESYVRVPLYNKKQRNAGEVPSWWSDNLISEGTVPHTKLLKAHGFVATAGYSREQAEGHLAEAQGGEPNTENEISNGELRAALGIETDAMRHVYDDYMTVSEDELSMLESALSEVDPETDTEAERARIDAMEASRHAFDRDSDPYFSFTGDFEGKLVSEYTTKDWNELGKRHGVKNLGGMGKLVKIAPGVEVPGGLDGKFTYEELLWLKHQAIDVYTMSREAHRALHRKIVRTMMPDPRDPLQVVNHFMFSMMSPNQTLTPNELGYAVARVRNMEESETWAKRVPWDVMKGETAGPEAFNKYDKDNEEAIAFIKAAYKRVETKRRKREGIKTRVNNRSIEWIMENRPGGHGFDMWYRGYYNVKIGKELGLQAKTKGGLGLLGTAEMSDLAELHQFFQEDPDWFLMQNTTDLDAGGMPSWHTYVERLSSQFRGMATKVASFAAVWQDPMKAAVSAIDRHMGRIYESALFDTPQDRINWEIKVIRAWNASKGSKARIKPEIGDEGVTNFDELFMHPAGDGFFVTKLMKLMEGSKNKFSQGKGEHLPDAWKQFQGKFLHMGEEAVIRTMSEHYKNALMTNAKQAEKLGMGLFATQWFEWDRYRRRLEPHEVMFPGLYKLPHLSKDQIASSLKAHSDAGYLTGTKEKIPVLDLEGRPTESVDIRMKPVRTAPLGSLNYHSFAEGPGHFPPGQGFRTPLYNLHQVSPLSGVDPTSGPAWGLPDASWKTRLITKFQDKFYRVKELQREIERRSGSIHEDMDAYLHEMLYHGRAADRVEGFEKEYVDPLVDHIRANDVNVPEFENWLHARHTKERNDHLDEVWEVRKRQRYQTEIDQIENEVGYNESRGVDTTVLKRRLYRRKKDLASLKKNIHHAGMSNADAAKVLAAAGTKFDDVAILFDNMMDQKLAILHEGGLITDKQLKSVSIYKHYVPLKGKEYKGDLEEILEDAGIHTGQGFDIRGDEIGFSFGRVGDTQHTQPILAQAVVDIEEAIVRVEKNVVGKSFLELVRQYKNDDLYKVNTVTQRRVWDPKTGTVRLVKDAFANREDNVIAVKEDGKTHYIEIYDARLASSMKNLGSKEMHQAVKLLARLNRFMAAVNTTFNPEFILANLIRDVQTAGFNLSTEELKSIQKETMLSIPLAVNGIRKAEGLTKQDESQISKDEWVQYYREYVEDGGKIGFFGYTDVHEKAKGIERKIRRAGKTPMNMTYSYAQAVGNFVSSSNSAVENATRLSAYVAARNAGVSRKKAAALGRNLTVNFNKKGDAGQVLNALYLFANASIQGTTRMLTAVIGSPRVRKMVGAQIMASYAMASMNRGIAGEDDEDGFPWWEKIGDWQKERNFIVMLPGADGNHIKIPLPYGYNVFHVLGTQMEAIAHATFSGYMTPGLAVRAAANMFNAIMTAFNPLGGASMDSRWQALRFVIPSAFAPIADTLVNETYYGAPIHPVRSSWDHSPDSERYFRSVSKVSQELMTYLNRWTGGSEYESGWLDLNPENLDYLVGAYAGAGPKTGVRGLSDVAWLWKALSGRDTSKYEANDMVFLRRIYGEVNDNTVSAVFYENIDGLSQGQQAYKNLEGEALTDWRDENRWMIPLFSRLKDAQKGIRDTEDPDAKNRIRKGFNKAYRRAWLSQFD